jgi:hypothetical protein
MHTTAPTDPIGPIAAPAGLRDALARIAADERLDRNGDAIAQVGEALGASPAGPYLRGEALGHSPHATLATLRFGVLGASHVAGVVGGRSGQKIAGRLAGLGVLMTAPVAATAAVEFARSKDDPEVRRVGALYAMLTGASAAFFMRSWLSRKRGHGFAGVLWGLLGAAPVTGAVYLLGHLTGALGFGSGPRGLDAPIDSPPSDEDGTSHNAVRAL